MDHSLSTLLFFLFLQLSSGMDETLSFYFPEIENDLTKVTWAHAVNSREKLDTALKSDVLMLEADITMGYTSVESKTNNDPMVAVMAHPPESISNFTLEEFITVFKNSGVNKGIKLDFKSRDAFAKSESILEKIFESYNRDFPIWLNADIIPGPINGTKDVLDPDYFLMLCMTRYPTATISVGWSTSLPPGSTEGKYTQEDLDRMTDVLNRNMVLNIPVTFAVRAAFAARSVDLLSNLIASSSGQSTTLTVWSSVDTDVVDIDGLKHLIRKVGKNKIYLDLPKEMMDKVNSMDLPTAQKASSMNVPLVAGISLLVLVIAIIIIVIVVVVRRRSRHHSL